MNNECSKEFILDNDTVVVCQAYDRHIGREVHLYPDFEKHPRYTPSGKRWVNATMDDCPYAENSYGDCGSCRHFRCQSPGDLIGICDNEKCAKYRKDA